MKVKNVFNHNLMHSRDRSDLLSSIRRSLSKLSVRNNKLMSKQDITTRKFIFRIIPQSEIEGLDDKIYDLCYKITVRETGDVFVITQELIGWVDWKHYDLWKVIE